MTHHLAPQRHPTRSVTHGLVVSQTSVLRLLRDEGLILEAAYQRERCALAARRKAAFATEPTRPNQVWQLDFSEFETTTGGTWRLAGCRDYWSKYEFGWHLSPTANQHDALAAIDLAIVEAARVADGQPLLEQLTDPTTGVVRPVTIVTDNGGPFRSFRFDAYPSCTTSARGSAPRARTGPESAASGP